MWAIRNAAALLPDGLVEDAVVVFDPGGILASGRSQEVTIPPNTSSSMARAACSRRV